VHLTDKPEHILTVSDLRFSYGDQTIFSDVSVTVRRGAMVGIIGPNGSGKSTLLHLLNGFKQPGGGVVRLDGENVHRMNPRSLARRIAYVPQQTVVAHDFSVMEIVLMGRFPYKSMVAFENDEDIRIAQEMLELTGVSEFRSRRFHSLSGGEQQRVIVAAALAQEPSLILLDEPTSALDIHYQMHIFNILSEMNRRNGLTVMCAIHDINLASLYCNRIWLLGEDNSIRDGSPSEIIRPEEIGRIFNVQLDAVTARDGRTWLIPGGPGGENSL